MENKKTIYGMDLNHYTAIESFLVQEFEWLNLILHWRIKKYFSEKETKQSLYDLTPPPISSESPYERYLNEYDLGFEERVIVAMIMSSILKPQIFDIFFTKNKITGMRFSEFGGTMEGNRFIPTYRTASFVLSDNQLPLFLNRVFQNKPPFSNLTILNLTDSSISSNIDVQMKLNKDIEDLLLGASENPH